LEFVIARKSSDVRCALADPAWRQRSMTNVKWKMESDYASEILSARLNSRRLNFDGVAVGLQSGEESMQAVDFFFDFAEFFPDIVTNLADLVQLVGRHLVDFVQSLAEPVQTLDNIMLLFNRRLVRRLKPFVEFGYFVAQTPDPSVFLVLILDLNLGLLLGGARLRLLFEIISHDRQSADCERYHPGENKKAFA
jgi:hypothetical protein